MHGWRGPGWHGIHLAQIKGATIVQIYLLTNLPKRVILRVQQRKREVHTMKHISTIYVVRNNETHRHTYYTKECAPAEARPMLYHTSKTINVHQEDGTVRTAYMYGEKSYSYDATEVAQYKEAQAAKRQREAERKAMLATIMTHYEAMDTEALAKVIATL